MKHPRKYSQGLVNVPMKHHPTIGDIRWCETNPWKLGHQSQPLEAEDKEEKAARCSRQNSNPTQWCGEKPSWNPGVSLGFANHISFLSQFAAKKSQLWWDLFTMKVSTMTLKPSSWLYHDDPSQLVASTGFLDWVPQILMVNVKFKEASWVIGVPPSSHPFLDGIFHHKPSTSIHFGYPPFQETLNHPL